MNLLRFKKDELLDAISRIYHISKKNKDAYTRSILVDPRLSGNCVFWVNSIENRFRAEAPLQNEGGRIEKPFVLEFKTFYELVKGHDGDTISIQEHDRKHRISTHNGVVDLENFARMESKIRDDHYWNPKIKIEPEWFTANSDEFVRFLSFAEKAMLFSLISSHRKACVHKGKAYFNFSNVVVVVGGFHFESLGIRPSDCKILKRVLDGTTSLKWCVQGNDYLFDAGSVKASVPRIDCKDIYGVSDTISDYDIRSSIEIPFEALYDGMVFASKLAGGSDIVAIECRSGKILLEASTKIGRNIHLPIAEGRDSFAVRFSVDLLKKILILLHFEGKTSDNSLKITVGTDSRAVFDLGDVQITAGAFK